MLISIKVFLTICSLYKYLFYDFIIQSLPDSQRKFIASMDSQHNLKHRCSPVNTGLDFIIGSTQAIFYITQTYNVSKICHITPMNSMPPK